MTPMPWWEKQLDALGADLRRACDGSYPAMEPRAREDVVQEALKSLTTTVRKNPNRYPSSWFEPEGEPNESEVRFLRALARKILTRRAIDFLRRNKNVRLEVPLDTLAKQFSDDPEPSRVVFARALAGICMELIEDLPEDDRDLITTVIGPTGDRRAMDQRDRKRISRLRARLRTAVKELLGEAGIEQLDELLGKTGSRDRDDR